MSAALALGLQAWFSARLVWKAPFAVRFRAILQALAAMLLLVALVSWNPADPSWNVASGRAATNWLGGGGAFAADLAMQSLGLAAWPAVLLLVGLVVVWFALKLVRRGWRRVKDRRSRGPGAGAAP